MMSWKKFLGQLVEVLFKMAVIYWLYIYQGRIAMAFFSLSYYYIAYIISFSFIALLVWWYINKEEGKYTLTFKDIRWQMWLWTLLLCIAQYMLISVLRGKLPVLITKDQITAGFTIYLFAAVLLGPVIEEILFRGFLQKHLSIKLPPWLAILIASVLFALIHYKTISNILPAFLGGIFCGIIYYRTGKLIICILFHAFYNLLGSILQFSFKYDNLVLRMLILMLVIGLAVYSIRGFMKNNDKKQELLIDNSEIEDVDDSFS